MAKLTLQGNPINSLGELPAVGSIAPDFNLVASDLSVKNISDFDTDYIVLNIFPSIDTGTCATSVRKFNESAAKTENTSVLCISRDLPFAMSRFCGAENLENVFTLSDFRDGSFGKDYQVTFSDGPLLGLHSRAIVVLNKSREVVYNEQVTEIADEPNYEAALAVIS